MWVKPQAWPIKSHCISQDKLCYAAITNIPSPSSQRLPTTKLHFHSCGMPTVGWGMSVQHSHPGDLVVEAPSCRDREESMVGCELSQNFCSKCHVTSSHISLARATHMTTQKFRWANKCDSTMCPQTRRPNICQLP